MRERGEGREIKFSPWLRIWDGKLHVCSSGEGRTDGKDLPVCVYKPEVSNCLGKCVCLSVDLCCLALPSKHMDGHVWLHS